MAVPYGLLADAVLVVHLAFIIFVVVGGFIVVRWPWLALMHLPCAFWGAYIEFANRVCPLTPLENSLRARAGEAVYEGGFIERYLLPILYPPGLTREVQIALGVLVIAVNVAAYGWVLRTNLRRSRSPSQS